MVDQTLPNKQNQFDSGQTTENIDQLVCHERALTFIEIQITSRIFSNQYFKSEENKLAESSSKKSKKDKLKN